MESNSVSLVPVHRGLRCLIAYVSLMAVLNPTIVNIITPPIGVKITDGHMLGVTGWADTCASSLGRIECHELYQVLKENPGSCIDTIYTERMGKYEARLLHGKLCSDSSGALKHGYSSIQENVPIELGQVNVDISVLGPSKPSDKAALKPKGMLSVE